MTFLEMLPEFAGKQEGKGTPTQLHLVCRGLGNALVPLNEVLDHGRKLSAR